MWNILPWILTQQKCYPFHVWKGQSQILLLTSFDNIGYEQSHYVEVAQRGVSSRARHNWFWIFSLFWAKKNYKRDIKQLFPADATVLFYKMFIFCPRKHEKLPSKVAHNRPQFFFIVSLKWLLAQLLYNDFEYM